MSVTSSNGHQACQADFLPFPLSAEVVSQPVNAYFVVMHAGHAPLVSSSSWLQSGIRFAEPLCRTDCPDMT